MNKPISHIMIGMMRDLLIVLLKITGVAFAWACKIIGTILSTFGEFIIKRMQK